MSIFGEEGQVDVQSLSDDALFAEEERQDSEQIPLAEPEVDTQGIEAENESAAEDEESPAVDNAEPESLQQAPKGQADVVESETVSRQQYNNLRKWATQAAMENGELKRQLEAEQSYRGSSKQIDTLLVWPHLQVPTKAWLGKAGSCVHSGRDCVVSQGVC